MFLIQKVRAWGEAKTLLSEQREKREKAIHTHGAVECKSLCLEVIRQKAKASFLFLRLSGSSGESPSPHQTHG